MGLSGHRSANRKERGRTYVFLGEEFSSWVLVGVDMGVSRLEGLGFSSAGFVVVGLLGGVVVSVAGFFLAPPFPMTRATDESAKDEWGDGCAEPRGAVARFRQRKLEGGRAQKRIWGHAFCGRVCGPASQHPGRQYSQPSWRRSRWCP